MGFESNDVTPWQAVAPEGENAIITPQSLVPDRENDMEQEALAIRVQGLQKDFGEVHAVRGISFDVRAGEIFSLLGPNGAGKSTTISMLSCLLEPTGGDALVLGHSVRDDSMAVKAAIGVVPQDIALYQDLSARENLVFWGKMHGLRGADLARRADKVLETIGLLDRQRGPISKFSGGMRRRLNVGVALLHRPKIVIMDEPTVGIDPQSRRRILDSVRELNRQGMTVLYTTHYMEEAQELSDHIAIMDQGRLVAIGTHEELVQIVGELDRIELLLNAEAKPVLKAWKAVPGVQQISDHERSVALLVDDSNVVLPQLFEISVAAGLRIISVQIQEPNLEAVFLHLTGRALRD